MKHPLLRFAGWTAQMAPAPMRRAFYRLGPLTRLLRRALNQVAPAGFTEVTVAAGPLAGVRMAVDLQLEKDYWLGTYETDVLAVLEEIVRPGMVAYDIGANIGYLTMALARWVGRDGSVYAFEALPENLVRLQGHVTLNGLENVTVVASAVIDRPGKTAFLIGPSGGTGKAAGSAGRRASYQDTVTVEALSLDHFVYELEHRTPDIVKMDIEGGETLALSGARRVLNQARPQLLLEVHGHESARNCWSVLTAARYLISAIGDPGVSIASPDQLPWKSYLWARPDDHD